MSNVMGVTEGFKEEYIVLCAQSCATLWDPLDDSLPGSSVHVSFQARILEWAAISSCRGSSQPRDRTRASCIAGRFFYQYQETSPNLPWFGCFYSGAASTSGLLFHIWSYHAQAVYFQIGCWGHCGARSGHGFQRKVCALQRRCTHCRNPKHQIPNLEWKVSGCPLAWKGSYVL